MNQRTCAVDGCNRPHDARGFCGPHYMERRRDGRLATLPKPTVFNRFMSHVQVTDSCWLWTAAVHTAGYGTFGKGYAHRWMWEHTHGTRPADGLHIDHVCRQRLCVNPDHLELVSVWENVVGRGVNSVSAIHYRQTHCDHGHEFTPQNTYRPPSRPNTRQCRACMRRRERQRIRRRGVA